MSSGIPSIPNISTSRPERLGNAFSMTARVSLCTWVMWTESPRASVSKSYLTRSRRKGHTSSRVQPSATSLALEMFGFLVVDQNL